MSLKSGRDAGSRPPPLRIQTSLRADLTGQRVGQVQVTRSEHTISQRVAVSERQVSDLRAASRALLRRVSGITPTAADRRPSGYLKV